MTGHSQHSPPLTPPGGESGWVHPALGDRNSLRQRSPPPPTPDPPWLAAPLPAPGILPCAGTPEPRHPHTAGCPSGQRERSVKPSAQPSLVRIQHLPPAPNLHS